MGRAGWVKTVTWVLALGLFVSAAPAGAENYSLATRRLGDYDEAMNLNGYVGVKSLDSGDWEGIDTQYAVGIDFDYATGPAAVVVALFHSRGSGHSDGTDVDARFTEAQVGVRKIWYRYPSLRPYLGGGGTALWMSIDDARIDADTRYTKLGLGLWAGGGAYLTLNKAWNVGLDLRGAYVPVSIRGEGRNAGGWQAGLVIGYHSRVW